jgi:hypothetical protein
VGGLVSLGGTGNLTPRTASGQFPPLRGKQGANAASKAKKPLFTLPDPIKPITNPPIPSKRNVYGHFIDTVHSANTPGPHSRPSSSAQLTPLSNAASPYAAFSGYPTKSSQEVGWVWQKPQLEIYGPTSANFAKGFNSALRKQAW